MSIVISSFDKVINNELIEENVEAIRNFINRGNMFIIATGKNYNTIKDIVNKYKLPIEYCICNDGAVIYDKYQSIIYREDINNIIGKNIYHELINNKNNLEIFIETTNGISKNEDSSINKLVANFYDISEAYIELSHITSNYPVIGYINNKNINIISNKVSKYNAINYLIKFYNFNINDIYTIGVDINDMGMVEKFLGFSIKESINDIKYKSYKVLPSIKELLDRL